MNVRESSVLVEITECESFRRREKEILTTCSMKRSYDLESIVSGGVESSEK